MANFCIPRDQVTKMQAAIRGISGSNQLQQLAEMSPEKRITFFKKTLNQTEATMLNKEFETAVSSARLGALRNWVRKNLDLKYRKDETIFLTKNFKSLEEVDAFIESRLSLFAEQKTGAALTDNEVKKLTELGTKYYDESKNLGDRLGNVDAEEANIAWGKTYKELELYKDSLLPRNWWAALVNNLGRSMMLLSIKTPFLNIESNSVNAITEAVARRVSGGTLYAHIDKKAVSQYKRFARKMFKETGVDFTRMVTLDDTITGVGKIVGEKARRLPWAGVQAIPDFVFNKTLTTPDVWFASFAFADSAALHASRFAKGDKEMATKLFKEATSIGATGDARTIREMAIADARMATYTNESWSAKFSEGVRNSINKTGTGLGDLLFPFVRTPASVAELSLTYAGLGVVKGSIGIGYQLIKNGKVDKLTMQRAFADFARSGIGFTTAFILAHQVKPENFIGAYDPQRTKIDQLANTAYNAVLLKTPIGDRWVSVDYLGPLGAPLVAMLYQKKYGKVNYVTGALSAYLAQMPIVDAGGFFNSLDTLMGAEPGKVARLGERIVGSAADTFASRVTPGIMYDLARASDEVQRDTRQKTFVTGVSIFDNQNILDKFAQKIPFLRYKLPIKYDALGRHMLESTPLETMFFGSRVRDARTDAVTTEILRLRNEGQTPTIKDLRFMYSSNVEELKEKLGDKKFIDVAIKYGETLGERVAKEIKTSRYKNSSDEEKKKILSDIGQDLYVQTLRQNGVRYR